MTAAYDNDDYRSEMEDDLADPPVAPVAPSAPAHTIEPELQQPTPRNVRVTFGTRLGRWIWIALAIGVPTVFAQFGNSSQAKFESLQDHGVETNGSLVGKEAGRSGKNGHPPRGTFQYFVNHNPYTLTIDFSEDEYRAARINDRRAIVYLPERPDVARMRDELVGRSYSKQALSLWGIGAAVGVILLLIWIFAERTRSRRQHLAAEGIAVPTTSVELTKVSSKSNDNNWKVSYTYLHDGQAYDGSGTFPLPMIQAMLARGNVATVLVDPYQPTRNELYRSVKRSVEVLPTSGGFGNA